MSRFVGNFRGVSRLLAGAAIGATALSFASVANAQPSAPASATDAERDAEQHPAGLGDIVVTARRVDENLQDVPISIGVLDSESLAARQIQGLQDLKGAVAGLTTSRTTTPGGGYITIRGKTGSAVPSPSADSAIGFYIDGVYVARGQGASAPILDVARVEVARGPQGTLFGRNSSAGAISFVTNVPTGKFEANGGARYGNYDQFQANLTVNVPLAESLAVRLSYQHQEYDGDVRNTTTSPGYIVQGYGTVTPQAKFGGANSDAYVARVRFTGIEGLILDYKYDFVDVEEGSNPNQLLGFLPSAGAATLASLFPIQPAGFVPQSFTRLGALAEDFQSVATIRNSGHLVQAEYTASSNISVKSITSWRKSKSGGSFDLDGGDWQIFLPPTFTPTSFCISCSQNRMVQNQFSQELQVVGNYDGASFIAGAYYFNERADFRTTYAISTVLPESPAVYVPPQVAFVQVQPGVFAPGPLALAEDGFYRNRSYAAYLHGDYEFTDRLKLSLGGRYTIDKKFSSDRRPFALTSSSVQYEKFNYDAALNFQLNPDVLLYGKYGNGYISGGIFKDISFKPETIDQVELGFKSELFDRRLRLNSAVYYTWIKDRQRAVVSINAAANAILAASGFSPPYPLGVVTYNMPGT